MTCQKEREYKFVITKIGHNDEFYVYFNKPTPPSSNLLAELQFDCFSLSSTSGTISLTHPLLLQMPWCLQLTRKTRKKMDFSRDLLWCVPSKNFSEWDTFYLLDIQCTCSLLIWTFMHYRRESCSEEWQKQKTNKLLLVNRTYACVLKSHYWLRHLECSR